MRLRCTVFGTIVTNNPESLLRHRITFLLAVVIDDKMLAIGWVIVRHCALMACCTARWPGTTYEKR